jgi:protein-L-isoaspartate O-methyltransferase
MSAAYFDAMYQAAADPWGFEDRWYEQRKYAISMALLPAARYRRALEAGCSIGVLTRMLAARCDEVLSCDIAAAAVQAAARRTEDLTHVRVKQRDIPGRWPDGRFDLIVFSEILYYLGEPGSGAGVEARVVHSRAGGHSARRALAASGGRRPSVR